LLSGGEWSSGRYRSDSVPALETVRRFVGCNPAIWHCRTSHLCRESGNNLPTNRHPYSAGWLYVARLNLAQQLTLRRKRGLNHGKLCTDVYKCVRRQRPLFGRRVRPYSPAGREHSRGYVRVAALNRAVSSGGAWPRSLPYCPAHAANRRSVWITGPSGRSREPSAPGNAAHARRSARLIVGAAVPRTGRSRQCDGRRVKPL
jgi:hypothetical protein